MLNERLPHACGGVSLHTYLSICPFWSSPRMWGCFLYLAKRIDYFDVFPTHVGVFPTSTKKAVRGRSLPHACGGVSPLYGFPPSTLGSSPRMWGCFPVPVYTAALLRVFPTHVGVFPIRTSILAFITGLPHACGGNFSSRTTYQRRAFHALGHIQQELRDGQAPRTPDLEKPFQIIPPPGILLGGHAGSPARGRHGFKPCPFRRSGRG